MTINHKSRLRMFRRRRIRSRKLADRAGVSGYLVDGPDTERFDTEVAFLLDEFQSTDLNLERTGPWPPYNFVPSTVGSPR